MKEETVNFCWLDVQSNSDLPLPCYKTENAAGMDICAAVTSSVCLHPGQRMVIGTGLAVAIPYGYEIQVRPRSGLAAKHGITVVNSPGTIDSDYRGELRVALINLGEEKFHINRGDRIAQLVVAPVVRATIELVDELDTTRRGDGGFGHTGV